MESLCAGYQGDYFEGLTPFPDEYLCICSLCCVLMLGSYLLEPKHYPTEIQWETNI